MIGMPGPTEVGVVIAILIILFVGPKQLPKMARSFGEALRELRESKKALKDAIEGDDAGKE